MAYEEVSETIASFDGTQVFYRGLVPTAPQQDGKTVLFIPGIGSHSGIVLPVLRSLAVESGSNTYFAMDLRGHGSSGVLGKMESANSVVLDIGRVIEDIRRKYSPKGFILVAESMATPFALRLVAEQQDALSGIVFISPAIMLHPRQLFHWQSLLDTAALLIKPHEPTLSIVNWRLDVGGGGARFRQEFRDDPRTLHRVSLDYLLVVGRCLIGWQWLYADKIRIPVLIAVGANDKLVSLQGAKALYRRLGSTDKQFRMFQDFGHHYLWAENTGVIYSQLRSWIDEH